MPRGTSTPPINLNFREPVIQRINELTACLNEGVWPPVDVPMKDKLQALLSEFRELITDRDFYPDDEGYELNGTNILASLEALKNTITRWQTHRSEASPEDEVKHYQQLRDQIKALEKSFSFNINPVYLKKKRRQSYAKATVLIVSLLAVLAGLIAVASIFIFPAFAGVFTILAILAQFSALAVLAVLTLAFIFVPPPLFAMISDKYQSLQRTLRPFSRKVRDIFFELKEMVDKTAKSVNYFSMTGQGVVEEVSARVANNLQFKRELLELDLRRAESDMRELNVLMQLSESALSAKLAEFSAAIERLNEVICANGFQGEPIRAEATYADLASLRIYANRVLNGADDYAFAKLYIQQREALDQMKVVAALLEKKHERLRQWCNTHQGEDYIQSKIAKYKDERRTSVAEKLVTRFGQRLVNQGKALRLDAMSFGKNTFHLFTPYSKKITRELLESARVTKVLPEGACLTVLSRLGHPKR